MERDDILWRDSSLQLFNAVLRVFMLVLQPLKGLSATSVALGGKDTQNLSGSKYNHLIISCSVS